MRCVEGSSGGSGSTRRGRRPALDPPPRAPQRAALARGDAQPIGREQPAPRRAPRIRGKETNAMNQIVYIVGAIVIVMAVLAFVGIR